MATRGAAAVLAAAVLSSCLTTPLPADGPGLSPEAEEGTAVFRELSTAISYLGTPYEYAGTDRDGIDCSGFVMAALEGLVDSPPRRSADYASFGEPVCDELRPGDILVFADGTTVEHVGIYLGDRMFIHAASEGPRTGVIVSSMDEAYWQKRYLCARRPPFRKDVDT